MLDQTIIEDVKRHVKTKFRALALLEACILRVT